MARKRKANIYNEEFKSSFGVNASVPDPVAKGKTVSTPLDDKTAQMPMEKIDDKGSKLTSGNEEVQEDLASNENMMSEILKVVKDSSQDSASRVFEDISPEDDDFDEVIAEGEFSDEELEAIEEELEDEPKEESFLMKHILKTLDEEDASYAVSEELEENEEIEEPQITERKFVWEDPIEEEIADEDDIEDYLFEADEKEEEGKKPNPFAKKEDGDKDDEEDSEESDSDEDEDDEDEDKDEGDKSKVNVYVNENPAEKDAKSEMKSLSKEDLVMEYNIDGLFEEGKFSKSFIRKTKSLFEAAVLANVNANLKVIHETAIKTAEKEALALRENLVKNLDSYLSYVVENYIEENKLAIQNGLRLEICENFMHELKGLFERHYIDVPESKIDLVDSLSEQLEKAKTDLNEEIKRNIAISRKLEEQKKIRVFEGVTKDIPHTHRNRLATLVEGIEYINDHDYEEKINDLKKMIVVESSVPAKKTRRKVITEDAFSNDYDGNVIEQYDNELMEAVVAKIEHLVRK